VKRSGWSPPVDTGLWQKADRMRIRLMRELPAGVKEHLTAELQFFDDITSVSGKLYGVAKVRSLSFGLLHAGFP
jgi:phosphatidylinositol 4-kinase A